MEFEVAKVLLHQAFLVSCSHTHNWKDLGMHGEAQGSFKVGRVHTAAPAAAVPKSVGVMWPGLVVFFKKSRITFLRVKFPTF